MEAKKYFDKLAETNSLIEIIKNDLGEDFFILPIIIGTDEIFPFKVDLIENGYFISIENKSNSFGWLNGKLATLDYGN